jgi:hypothetical protein
MVVDSTFCHLAVHISQQLAFASRLFCLHHWLSYRFTLGCSGADIEHSLRLAARHN